MAKYTQQQIIDMAELRNLVDSYAIESDKGNQDYYRNIFAENLNLRLFSGGNVTEIKGVEEMIKIYKAFGAAKISFHQTGQQAIDFQDADHATGVVYLTALLVNEKATKIYIRYEDKYARINGRWQITDRDQYMLYTEN